MENVFWDKKASLEEIKNILRDESHEEFISFAAILLSRTRDIKGVFSTYLDKVIFCKNWRRIKQKMRKADWNSPNIKFWNEVYNVVIDKEKIQIAPRRNLSKESDLGSISNIIRKARKSRKWTQKMLAKRSGLSQQTISLMENGKFNFSFKSLIEVLNVLRLRCELRPVDEYRDSADSVQIGLKSLEQFKEKKPLPFENMTSGTANAFRVK